MRGQSGRNAIPGRTGAPVSSYPSGRVCEKDACATVLSKYNPSPFCSVHEPWMRKTGARP
jgi:hypothetical protein